MPKASQRQFIVKVSTIDGYFASKTGGDTSADSTDVWDGGALTPEKLASPAATDDVTVGRPYDPDRDQAVINRLRPLVGRFRTTVSVQPTDADLVARGRPTVFANALLTALTSPEVDASSGDPAMFELTFAVESVA